MSRSGTVSLSKALTTLGFGPVYHGSQLVTGPSDCRAWVLAVTVRDGQASAYPDGRLLKLNSEFFDTILGGYQAISDLPGAAFAVELAKAYPDARVIMNVRDVDGWHKSLSEALAFYVNGPYWFEYFDRAAFWMRRYCDTNFQPIFDYDFQKNGMRVYGEHTKHVLESIPKERLLEWKLGDGWEPLCKFLGEPVPEEPFPYGNASPEMIKRRKMMGDKLRNDAIQKVAIATAVLIGTIAVIFQGLRML